MYQKIPPKGMRDFLPGEKALRDEIAGRIRGAYRSSGFTEIETSAVEHLENLSGGDGGENTKLIFKIMKRGEKLDEALKSAQRGESNENDFADLGLRFDFTLPLTRFYSNNRNELPQIFKAMQLGMVYRGERPQKGRYRSFVQCDVDIIGDPSPLAEIEILSAAIKALRSIGLDDFEIRISDRRFLLALISACGLPQERADEVCISLDKYDKVGREGVIAELAEKGLDGAALLDAVEEMAGGGEGECAAKSGSEQAAEASPLLDIIGKYSAEAAENLRIIAAALAAAHSGDPVRLRFDPTLVRGMGYYTSTIYEVHSNKYGSALGGGGRYDKMIGKISGTDAPAAGFSIGFERICDLVDKDFLCREQTEKIAILVESPDDYAAAISYAWQTDAVTSIFSKKKKFGKQLQTLESEGFTKFYDASKGEYLMRGE